ncbi:MAG: hypothetical protein M0Q27_03440 [Candidatus Colwellbacteria bacterium]|nr:hypothetical protein [Candidatus Colwellbacteria bacterium]
MKDFWHEWVKVLDYERGKIAGLALGLILAVVLVGCDVTIQSPISGQTVTQSEYTIEAMEAQADIESLLSEAEKKAALLAQKNQLAQEEFEIKQARRDGIAQLLASLAIGAAGGEAVSVPVLINSLLLLGGLGGAAGGVYDAYRKNQTITALKESAQEPSSA